MTVHRSIHRVSVAVVAVAILAGGALVAPVASSSAMIQPRGATAGVWAQVGQGFAIGSDDTLSQVFQLTSKSQLPQLAGGSDTIYAAGSFTFSGTTPVNRVARLHDGEWVTLPGDDTGIAPGATRSLQDKIPSPGVYGLALGGDDSLYAGGQFWGSDDSLNNVGQWSGSDWIRMGNGLRITNSANGYVVQDMVVGNDFIGGDDTNYGDDTVYALGGFTHTCATLDCTSDGRLATGVTQYSQADDTWLPMANGTMSNASQAFAGAYIDDTLYVGGNFSSIGGVSAFHVAQWRESDDTWVPMGAGLGIVGNAVYAMAVHPTTKDLYVGGTFGQPVGETVGSTPGIIKWDYLDDTWYSVGTGLASGNVDDIAFSADGTTMWLGLDAGAVDGASANFVAQLTSSSFTSTSAGSITGAWNTLVAGTSVGVDGPVNNLVNQTSARTVLPIGNDSAIFGGNFHTAGAVPAGRVARFSPPAPPPPRPPRPPAYPPDAPTGVTAVGAVGSVAVSWAAPSSTGSFPITNYRVTATPGGATCEVNALTCTFTNLTVGTSYTFQAQAYNAEGWGPLSSPSNAASPLDPPPPPPPASITIDASQRVPSGRGTEVSVGASAVSIAAGTAVVPWTRVGRGEWTASPKSAVVSSDGSVAWKRKFGARTNRNIIAVKFVVGELQSSEAILRPVR